VVEASLLHAVAAAVACWVVVEIPLLLLGVVALDSRSLLFFVISL